MSTNENTAPAHQHEREFLRVLPFAIQQIDPDGQPPMPVALWKDTENHCEGGGHTRCDDSAGLYYTIVGDEVTWWCPRHWYENLLGPNAPYRLLDMTEEQYEQEQRNQKERLLKDWAIVADRIETSANILSSAGLQEQAGKLRRVYGDLRTSIQNL